MQCQSKMRKMKETSGSYLIELITELSNEVGCEPKDVTVDITDTIDGTFVEVTANKG